MTTSTPQIPTMFNTPELKNDVSEDSQAGATIMSAETIKVADIKSFPITILVGANLLTLKGQMPGIHDVDHFRAFEVEGSDSVLLFLEFSAEFSIAV